ncbi:uncharacterized protein BJ171DRAFT_425473 [Polychytrium aggregatum]|uniref:uncharacterized protein n=1 Tax=Polychytrium aggregatum TaxID=110093 RepID=UPI0022FE6EFB|nr:uncharacterized protein BJ171DRAFT_425473 [Polychytrium aggregatum]KAI9203251.1 hypothetical protein BJ171DRAFT_425473 [Polychytrium aggregatum]
MYEQNVNNINFDVEQLETASGQSLYYIAWSIFRQHGFFEQFNIPEPIFLRWLKKVQHGYRGTNPYHNAVHASDVTHSMHFFVTRARIWSVLTPEEKLASIIAPIIHDYMHPGVNNAFLITTRDALTMRYNDLSVLENFHCASVLEFTQEEQYNLFVNMTVDQRKLVREMVISMVLATDMAAHFEWIGKFKNKMSGSGFNFENKADRKIMLNMAIKCADVNNPTKPLEQSKRWTELIMEEFFRQGDIERSRGIPISMFMNRETTDIPKCQIGFIDFIAQPLFDAWYSFMQEDIQILMDNIKGNKNYWKNKSEKVSFGPIKPTPSSTESLSNTAKASALAIPPGSNIQTSVSTQQITNTKSSDSLAR